SVIVGPRIGTGIRGRGSRRGGRARAGRPGGTRRSRGAGGTGRRSRSGGGRGGGRGCTALASGNGASRAERIPAAAPYNDPEGVRAGLRALKRDTVVTIVTG